MAIFKGFVQIDVLADNNEHTVSPIGEFSADSNTFVRDYGIHTHSEHPGITLLGLSSRNNDGDKVDTPSNVINASLEIADWIHDKARSGFIGPSKATLLNTFNSDLNNKYSLLGSGEHISLNGVWYPSSLVFSFKGNESIDRYTLWFSDVAFNNEFDESIILIVPPIENIDQFFNPRSTVESLLEQTSRSDITSRIDLARGRYPYTILRMDGFDWTDPNNEDISIKTYWNIIIYGRAGNNVDSIKEAIQAYVANTSNRSVDDWSNIFPDIFKSTEIIVAPTYFNQAVPNQQFERGIFSGISTPKDMYELLKKVSIGPGYNNNFIFDSMVSFNSLYRSVALAVVTGPENKNGFETFRKIFWDYIDVPTTHPDFMRMRKETRDFLLILTEMVEYAESLTPTSTVPVGYNRIERDGVWYIGRSNDDFLTLVVTKYSLDKILEDLDLPTDRD